MSVLNEMLRRRAASLPAGPALVTRSVNPGGHEMVWTWAELDHVTARIADGITGVVDGPAGHVLLATVASEPARLIDLISMLRTDLPVAVLPRTAPPSEEHALCEALRRCGQNVVRIHQGRFYQSRAHISRLGSSTQIPLPTESVVMPTGGSSGRPKVVIDPQMRLVGKRPRASRPSSVMKWRSGQHQLVMGALHHTATLTFFIEGLSDGNTMIVPQYFDPALTLGVIPDWDVEWLHLTPYHLRHLAMVIGCRNPDLSSVRAVLHLAAPCSDTLKRYWLDLLGAERVFELYGSTEGIGLTLARGDEWAQRPGTVGKGFFTEIQILDDSGQHVPDGQTGEIYMRSGPPGRRFYLNQNDNLRSTVDGFASVGDRGWLDADGYLYLTARQLARIQVGGETVDPSEVESMLAKHPDVLEVAVTGIHDERLGESLVALVVSAGARDPSSLRRFLRERITRYKVPRAVLFVDELPQTPAGKVDRLRLADIAAAARPLHKELLAHSRLSLEE